MKKLLVLIGIPASGKSTFAMDLLKKEDNWFRVSRDDIRMTMFGTEFNPHIEGFVSKIQNMLILKALKSDHNVVIDNCNVRESYRNDLYNLAKLDGNVMYEEMIFKTSLQECLERNKQRSRKVPEEAIIKFAKEGRNTIWGTYKPKKEFIPKTERSFLVQDESLPGAIICDLDGTLCLMNGRNPYDASTADKDLPNVPVLETVKLYHSIGYNIIFCSGREDKFREPTESFLKQHFVDDLGPLPYSLLMRKTGDQRKDAIIKREIFDANIRDKYNVLFVLDDRNQVVEGWRDIGLTCFQVAEGDF